MSVIVSKHQCKVTCITANAFCITSAHEDSVFRYEYVIKDCQRLNITYMCIRSIQVLSLVVQSRKSHQLDAVPVSRKSKCYCIISILCIHELCRKSADLIYIGCAGVTDLSTTNDDTLARLSINTNTIYVSLNYVEELIRIRLLMSSLIFLISGALNVSLCTVNNKIMLLNKLDVVFQSLMIVCAASLIAVIGYGIQSVHCICTHASLHTSAYSVADQTSHQLFLQQIVYRVMNMAASVMYRTVFIFDHTNICKFRIVCCFITDFHNVSTALDPVSQISLSALLAVRTVNLLSMKVNVWFHLEHSLFVLLIGSDCHIR